jgi:hypothetical protein
MRCKMCQYSLCLVPGLQVLSVNVSILLLPCTRASSIVGGLWRSWSECQSSIIGGLGEVGNNVNQVLLVGCGDLGQNVNQVLLAGC